MSMLFSQFAPPSPSHHVHSTFCLFAIMYLYSSLQIVSSVPLFWTPHIWVMLCAKSLQSCLTLRDPMDCSPPGSSIHGILQTKILEWVAMPSSRGSSRPRNQTRVSCSSSVADRFFTNELPGKPRETCPMC